MQPLVVSREGPANDACDQRRSRVLWRLQGATDELCALAVETSYGWAFGLELDRELVLLHLQPSLDSVVAYAGRIHDALIAHGWQVMPARGGRSQDQ